MSCAERWGRVPTSTHATAFQSERFAHQIDLQINQQQRKKHAKKKKHT